jgi:hypothetical protein
MAVIPPTSPILPAATSLDLPAGAPVTSVQPSFATRAHAVAAELQLGRVSPDEAVSQLVAQALESFPETLRPAVEVHLRSALAHDPLLASLVENMGARLPTEG